MSRPGASVRLTHRPDGLITDPLDEVIDPENFTPRLLALVSNALVWRESSELRARFDLGTNDWRVLSALALRPGVSATEVCDFIGVNKAVISKSVNTLSGRGLVALADGPRGSRPLYLTHAGAQMHADMLPISVAGQDIIVQGLPAADIAELNALLRAMFDKLRSAP